MSEPEVEVSPFLGGPLYRLYRRAGLLRTPLDLVGRRIAVLVAATWLPLFVLSFTAPAGGVSFLHDLEVQARFLITLPLFLFAEVSVDDRTRKVLQQFLERGVVPVEVRPKFEQLLGKTVRWADSRVIEILLVVFVYTVGHRLWRDQVALGQATWYAVPTPSGPHYTAAGTWLAYFGVPLFQFLLLRWYVRLFLWFQLLWRISRLDLRLDAAHPDHCGGLGFVGNGALGFAPLLFAQGAQLGGVLANRIFHEGMNLLSFKVEIAGVVVFFMMLFMGPYTVFTPLLIRTKRHGLRVYGGLAHRYVEQFRHKWIEGRPADSEPLIGSADIQSLADMGNSFQVVRGMRLVPFAWMTLAQLALFFLAPILPLTLTVVPLESLLDRLIKSVL